LPVNDSEVSIAVLPFDDLSVDNSQAYFAEGIADDIITDLIKISGIRVIARQSSFQYREIEETAGKIGNQLGVKFILQGTVQRADERLRINAQLIEVGTGDPIWAERYEGSVNDVFALQDRITNQIIGAFEIRATKEEMHRISIEGTNNTNAYDAFLRGRKLLAERKLRDYEKYKAAADEFKKALEFDPDYAEAIAGLAWVDWLYKQSTSVGSGNAEFDLARKSIQIRDNARARRLLAKEHFSLQTWYRETTKNTDEAVRELERAHTLAPNDPDVIADLAIALSFSGNPRRGVKLALRAQELNPSHPEWYYSASGIALLLSDNPARAASHLLHWSEANPDWYLPLLFLSAAQANAGDLEMAEVTLRRSFQQRHYEIMTPAVVRGWPMQETEEEVFIKGLRLAGMRDRFE
jgi:TolB-like protein